MKLKLFGITIFEKEDSGFDRVDRPNKPDYMGNSAYDILKGQYCENNDSFLGEMNGCRHSVPACSGCRKIFGS